jgi:iron-sulfur cluster assembly accessory protein
MDITVTQAAHDQLVSMGLETGEFLRIGVKPGGCAGMSYDAVLDRNFTANDDVVYEEGTLRVVAHIRFLPLLEGLTIDFSDDLVRPGFILKNPNVQQSCGCGSSFSTENADSSACEGCPS